MLYAACVNCIGADKAWTLGKIGMRHARPQDHNATTVRTKPVERTLMNAQATAHEPSRGIKELFEIAKTEGRAAPRAESAGSAVPGNQIDGLATVVSAEDDGLNTGG